MNQRTILSHVTAYGPEGPWGPKTGFDGNGQALSGWERGGAGEGNPPMTLRSVMDPFTGLVSFVASIHSWMAW